MNGFSYVADCRPALARALILFGALAAALVVTALPALAQHRLGPSDGVRIKLRDWPDLAGDYTVGPDGAIAMPVIGQVPAASLGPAELGEAIAERLQKLSGSSERPVTAVEIIRFRPVFVMGDVQRPGEHVYRPGLTVLQAVSMAGGYYRPTSSSILRTERDIAQASGDVEAQTLRLRRALARAARLEASLAGADSFDLPPELAEADRDAGLALLIANERTILTLERRRAAEEAQSLEGIRELYRREIASLSQQAEALKREQEAVQRQLGELRGLAGRGLALTPNLISLERTLAQNQNEQLGMGTAIVRARQQIELAEQKQRSDVAERMRLNAAALQEAKGEAADARLRVETARELVDEALVTERVEGRNPGLEIMRRREVILVRQEGDGGAEGGRLVETPAGDAVTLQPGDVLKVMPLPPRRLDRLGQAGGRPDPAQQGREQQPRDQRAARQAPSVR